MGCGRARGRRHEQGQAYDRAEPDAGSRAQGLKRHQQTTFRGTVASGPGRSRRCERLRKGDRGTAMMNWGWMRSENTGLSVWIAPLRPQIAVTPSAAD